MHRTCDRVMDLGEYLPKSTIPVAIVGAVPIRAIGGLSSR
jgi:hypothetical protein